MVGALRCMARPQAFAAALAMLAPACSPPPVRVSIDAIPGAKSVLFAVERGARLDALAVEELVATDLPEDGATNTELDLPSPVLDYEPEEAMRITVIGFGLPLENVGLQAGRVDTAIDKTAQPILEIRPRIALRQIDITGGAAGSWSEATTLPAPLGDVRIDTGWPAGCTRFSRREVPTTSTQAASFALALDAGTALIGLEDQTLLRISTGGALTDVTPQRAEPVPTWGALRESADVLWLAGREGSLWRVRIDAVGNVIEVLERHQLTTWVTTPTQPMITRHPQFRWIGGHATPGSVEIFMLSVEGVLAKFDGAEIKELRRFELRDTDWRGGLAYLGPGEAMAGFITSQDVLHVRGATVTPMRLNKDTVSGVTGLSAHPALGVVAADSLGNAFRFEDGVRWTKLFELGNVLGIDILLPYRSGLLAGGPGGFVQEWIGDEDRLCPAQQGLARQTFRYFVQLGPSILATGPVTGTGAPLYISLLDPQ